MTRILIINPNSSEDTVEILRQRVKELNFPDIDAECVALQDTSPLISTYEDCAMAAPELVTLIREREKEFDAFVVACYSDPNLDVLKEITDKPVMGMAECSMKLASMFGDCACLVSPTKRAGQRKIQMARKYYCQDILKEIVVPKEDSADAIVEVVKEVQTRQFIDIVLLGCANYALYDKEVQEKLGNGVMVLDGLACALFVAAGFSNYFKSRVNKEG